MSEIVVKWGKSRGGGESLQKALWRCRSDLLIHAPVYKGALAAVETSQIPYWTTCSVCQWAEHLGSRGLLAFLMWTQCLLIRIWWFLSNYFQDLDWTVRWFFAMLVLNWSQVWWLQYGYLPEACTHNFLICFSMLCTVFLPDEPFLNSFSKVKYCLHLLETWV